MLFDLNIFKKMVYLVIIYFTLIFPGLDKVFIDSWFHPSA